MTNIDQVKNCLDKRYEEIKSDRNFFMDVEITPENFTKEQLIAMIEIASKLYMKELEKGWDNE